MCHTKQRRENQIWSEGEEESIYSCICEAELGNLSAIADGFNSDCFFVTEERSLFCGEKGDGETSTVCDRTSSWWQKAIAFSSRESVGVASRRHRFREIGNAIDFW